MAKLDSWPNAIYKCNMRANVCSLNAALCQQQFHLSSVVELGIPKVRGHRFSIVVGGPAARTWPYQTTICVSLWPTAPTTHFAHHGHVVLVKLHKIVFRFVSLGSVRFFHWKCAFKIYCSHKHKINCIWRGGVLTIEITICWKWSRLGFRLNLQLTNIL